MAAVINARDVVLQAASPRTVSVNLGSTVNVNGTVSGNVTGTLNGTAVSTVVNAALSATANYFTTSASDPTGGANGDAHYNSSTGVMWFKISGSWTVGGTISASQIITGTLAAARIAASSITSDKLSVSSLSAIAANLGTVTAGNISGTANITISGTAKFTGDTISAGGRHASVIVNDGYVQQYGIVGYAGDPGGTIGAGVYGDAIGQNADGVLGWANQSGRAGVSGQSAHPSGFGVYAQGTIALAAVGAMTITSSALVSNLRSATTLLADNSTKWSGYSNLGTSTGASTATFVATNKPGSNSSNTWLTMTDGSTTLRWPVWTI